MTTPEQEKRSHADNLANLLTYQPSGEPMSDAEWYKNLGEKIARLRRANGLTQVKLAAIFGSETATMVSLVESGKRRPSVLSLVRFCRAIQIPITELL